MKRKGALVNRPPVHQKILALTLFIVTPAGLSGCTSSPLPPTPPVANQPTPIPPNSSDGPLTAFDECEWDREMNGWDIDCGDSDIAWYREHGYTTKHSYVPSTSLFYRKMRGTEPAPAPSSSTTPKPVSPTPSVSGNGNSGLPKSPAFTPTSPQQSGVGSGGTSNGGFSTGG